MQFIPLSILFRSENGVQVAICCLHHRTLWGVHTSYLCVQRFSVWVLHICRFNIPLLHRSSSAKWEDADKQDLLPRVDGNKSTDISLPKLDNLAQSKLNSCSLWMFWHFSYSWHLLIYCRQNVQEWPIIIISSPLPHHHLLLNVQLSLDNSLEMKCKVPSQLHSCLQGKHVFWGGGMEARSSVFFCTELFCFVF